MFTALTHLMYVDSHNMIVYSDRTHRVVNLEEKKKGDPSDTSGVQYQTRRFHRSPWNTFNGNIIMR